MVEYDIGVDQIAIGGTAVKSSEATRSDVQTGDMAPDFRLSGTTGEIGLDDLKGSVAVLYFYPRDNTPGCTTEACDFRDTLADFQGMGIKVVGISMDPLASHEKFTAKYQLPFPLLADVEGDVSRAYGVYKEKKLYGKTHFGIERSTFVIDRQGRIKKVWRKVRVPGHVEAVRAFVRDLVEHDAV